MHDLLKKALEKAGVDNVSELNEFEKADYDRYAAILEKPELNVADIATFCTAQKRAVESQFGGLDDSIAKKDRLMTMHFIYSKILWFILGSKAERQAAERELEDLLKKP